MKRTLIGSLVILTLGLFGCHANDATPPATTVPGKPPVTSTPPAPANRFAGTWALNKSAAQTKSSQPITAEASLDIKENNEWTLTFHDKDKTHTAQGAATITSSQITLVPTTVDGKTPKTESEKKPAILVLSDDGKRLTGNDKESEGMVFDKK